MGDYESGYDAKYGYNRNAFAHKTIGTAIMGRIVKLIVTPIGLTSEAIHHHKDKKKRSVSQPEALAAGTTATTKGKSPLPGIASLSEEEEDGTPPVYVDVPADQADELIASDQAIPADGEEATHELVLEDAKDDGFVRNEADWALDEAASETDEKAGSGIDRKGKGEGLVAQETVQSRLLAKSKAHSRMEEAPVNKLPFPVIIPQRRPGTKARGFVRAYAPLLQDLGIDQDVFLRFLKNFHRAAQASPIFEVVMIATAIAGVYPDIVVGLAVQAVQIAAGIGQEIQERLRTNKFLDQANKDLFMPKGLFALIVTYTSGDSEQMEIGAKTVDLGALALAKYGDASVPPEMTNDTEVGEQEKQGKLDELKEKMKALRIASGETHGEAELPVTCAPLTFPALDAMAAAAFEAKNGNSEGVASSFKTKSKSTSKFVNDYFDRRAQATYAAENSQSTLTSQMGPAAPQFKSRFADPNNATNMHFFTLITGGRYKAEPLGARRRYERAQRKAEGKRLERVKEKGSKRLLQEGVLYLMVVNMPTEQELEKAKKEIREAKGKKTAKKNNTAVQ